MSNKLFIIYILIILSAAFIGIRYLQFLSKKYSSKNIIYLKSLFLLSLPWIYYIGQNQFLEILNNIIISLFENGNTIKVIDNKTLITLSITLNVSTLAVLLIYRNRLQNFIVTLINFFSKKDGFQSQHNEPNSNNSNSRWDVGITKTDFKELSKNEFYLEYIMSTFNSNSIEKYNENLHYLIKKTKFKKEIILVQIDENTKQYLIERNYNE